jgi:hypothetical protein
MSALKLTSLRFCCCIRYLFLHKDSFDDLQRYEIGNHDSWLPVDAFPRLFPQLVFIILAPDLEDIGGGDSELTVEADYDVHIYGEIVPMEMIKALQTRTTFEDARELHEPLVWHNFLERHDEVLEPSQEEEVSDVEILNIYQHHTQTLTLHKDARFSTNEAYPLEFLQDSESPTEPSEWSFDMPEDNSFELSPEVDIRHLSKDDTGYQETLQGVVWLLHVDRCLRWLRRHRYPGADVRCRSEMVLPLLQTVSWKPPRYCVC